MLYVILTVAALGLIFVGPMLTLTLPGRWLPLWGLALLVFYVIQNYIDFLAARPKAEVLLPIIQTYLFLFGSLLNLAVLIWRWSTRQGYGR
jgi:hypothetical protein